MLPVTLAASGACSVAGFTVTVTGAGLCTLTASQAGNGTYAAATNVVRSFVIFSSSAPTNTLAPSISGTAKVNTQLTTSPGTWGGYPAPSETYSYAWFSCTRSGSASATRPSGCSAISGATTSTFTPPSNQFNKYLRVRVTATNSAGTRFYFSAATAKVVAAPANTAAPKVTGTTTVGRMLTAARGTWSGSPTITFAYQWFTCTTKPVASATLSGTCDPIDGAAFSTYTLVVNQRTTFVLVRVTATNGYGSAVHYSAATTAIR